MLTEIKIPEILGKIEAYTTTVVNTIITNLVVFDFHDLTFFIAKKYMDGNDIIYSVFFVFHESIETCFVR